VAQGGDGRRHGGDQRRGDERDEDHGGRHQPDLRDDRRATAVTISDTEQSGATAVTVGATADQRRGGEPQLSGPPESGNALGSARHILRSFERQLGGPTVLFPLFQFFRSHGHNDTPNVRHKKAPDDTGAFELLEFSRDQYFPTSGPPQLKR